MEHCYVPVVKECSEEENDEAVYCEEVFDISCRTVYNKHGGLETEAECQRLPRTLCGSRSCKSVGGPRECFNQTNTVISEVPQEVCDLVPQKTCHNVYHLVPFLQPVQHCEEVPRKVCSYELHADTSESIVDRKLCFDLSGEDLGLSNRGTRKGKSKEGVKADFVIQFNETNKTLNREAKEKGFKKNKVDIIGDKIAKNKNKFRGKKQENPVDKVDNNLGEKVIINVNHEYLDNETNETISNRYQNIESDPTQIKLSEIPNLRTNTKDKQLPNKKIDSTPKKHEKANDVNPSDILKIQEKETKVQHTKLSNTKQLPEEVRRKQTLDNFPDNAHTLTTQGLQFLETCNK